jgi:hypothetical protein
MATASLTCSRTRCGDFQLSKPASSSAPRMKYVFVASCRFSERIDGTRVPIEPHARLRDVGEGE